MLLGFKATKKFKYHYGDQGRIDDGEFKEYPEDEAQRLLTDFPDNFFIPQKQSKANFVDDVMDSVKKETEEKVVDEEKTADKMVSDEGTKKASGRTSKKTSKK